MIIFRSDGAGDLHAAVEEVAREGGDGPVPGADVGGAHEEVGQLAPVQALLAGGPGGQQLAAAGAEAALQVGHEGAGFRRQDPVDAGVSRTGDGDDRRGRLGGRGEAGRGAGHGGDSKSARPPWTLTRGRDVKY